MEGYVGDVPKHVSRIYRSSTGSRSKMLAGPKEEQIYGIDKGYMLSRQQQNPIKIFLLLVCQSIINTKVVSRKKVGGLRSRRSCKSEKGLKTAV